MCWGHMCVPTKRAESLFRASTLQEPFKPHTSTREERAEGSAASVLYERDYNATRFSPVETSDHTVSFYISDGIFGHVALCCNGTSIRENTHGKLCEDSSQSQLKWGGGSFPHYRPSGKCFRNFHSSLTSYIVFKVWLYIFKNLIR